MTNTYDALRHSRDKWAVLRLFMELVAIVFAVGVGWATLHTDLKNVTEQHAQIIQDMKEIKADLREREKENMDRINSIQDQLTNDEQLMLSPSELDYLRRHRMGR